MRKIGVCGSSETANNPPWFNVILAYTTLREIHRSTRPRVSTEVIKSGHSIKESPVLRSLPFVGQFVPARNNGAQVVDVDGVPDSFDLLLVPC